MSGVGHTRDGGGSCRVGWVKQGWVGHAGERVGHVGVGESCRGGSCRGVVGWVMQGWGGPCKDGVGHAGVGWVM